VCYVLMCCLITELPSVVCCLRLSTIAPSLYPLLPDTRHLCFHSSFHILRGQGKACFFSLYMDREGEESGNNAAGLEIPKYGISFCAYAPNSFLQMRLHDDGEVFYAVSKPVGSVAGNLLYCGTPNPHSFRRFVESSSLPSLELLLLERPEFFTSHIPH
jgi:hypothetical protein